MLCHEVVSMACSGMQVWGDRGRGEVLDSEEHVVS